MVIRSSLTAIFLAAAIPAVGQALDPASGRLTAFVCESLPSPLRVEIESPEGSSRTDSLKRVLIRALAARHAVVAPGAPLRLSLYVGSVREAEVRKGRDLGEFSRGNASDERTRFRINLWSNKRDSVIGGRRHEILTAAVDELHVEITLDDQSDGRCIWQGEAVHRLDGRDEQSVAEQIIPKLIERLGQSASAEPIALE